MKKYYKFLVASSVASLSLGSAYYLKNEKELLASWTTNHEPSVQWNHNWDRRAPSSLIKPARSSSALVNSEKQVKDDKTKDDFEVGKHSSKATRHIFLIRHGQYEIKANEAELRVLTKLGREQAALTGLRLNELASKINFTKMHKSTMIRAVQTADIIKSQLTKEIPVSIDPLLCEGAPIPPEPPVGHWKPELYQFYEDGSRIEAAYRKYFYRAPPEQLEDSYEIIVCHANVIRYFFCRALQFPPEAWLRFDLAHGSITHIHVRPDGRVGCRALGESGFLPIPKISR